MSSINGPFGAKECPPLQRQTSIFDAIFYEEEEVLRTLIKEANGDLELRNSEGMTPFIFAAKEKNIEAMELLQEGGADIDAACNEGRTALHYAALDNADSIIEHLIEKGARTDIKDLARRTPIDVARIHNFHRAVNLLTPTAANAKNIKRAARSS